MSESALVIGAGRGYRYYTGLPVFHFGEGRSYSTFTYHAEVGSLPLPSFATISNCLKTHSAATTSVEAGTDTMLILNVTVQNVGQRSGDETVLCFTEPPAEPRAVAAQSATRILRDFHRVALAPGQGAHVACRFSCRDLSLTGVAGNAEVRAGRWTLTAGTARVQLHL